MKTITLENIEYQIEGDHYNGDILLTSPSQDLTIKGGYTELSCKWFDIEGPFKLDLETYLSENIEGYIKKNAEFAEVNVNE